MVHTHAVLLNSTPQSITVQTHDTGQNKTPQSIPVCTQNAR